MLRVGFEPTMQWFGKVKTVHATNRRATAIGLSARSSYKMKLIQDNNVLFLQHAQLYPPQTSEEESWVTILEIRCYCNLTGNDILHYPSVSILRVMITNSFLKIVFQISYVRS
jgi:hypothetical protein